MGGGAGSFSGAGRSLESLQAPTATARANAGAPRRTTGGSQQVALRVSTCRSRWRELFNPRAYHPLVRGTLAVCLVFLIACAPASAPAQPPPSDDPATAPQPIATSAMPAPAPSSAPAPTSLASSLTPPECTGADEQLRGSTCCQRHAIRDESKHPGQVFLDCHGPQIGKSCTAKTDCDVVCSCEPDDGLKSPHDDPSGPKDGTRGVQGVCRGRLQIGVWMCQIDERGVVSHVIVD
jgi:hypothetical protein